MSCNLKVSSLVRIATFSEDIKDQILCKPIVLDYIINFFRINVCIKASSVSQSLVESNSVFKDFFRFVEQGRTQSFDLEIFLKILQNNEQVSGLLCFIDAYLSVQSETTYSVFVRSSVVLSFV